MRLIYAFLAIRMIRLARFDLARSERLHRDGDDAFERSRERVRLADALAARADLPSRAAIKRWMATRSGMPTSADLSPIGGTVAITADVGRREPVSARRGRI